MIINVVDQIPGAGKTSAAINYINSIAEDAKIMYVTPFNNKEKDKNGKYKNANEVARIIASCPDKHFKEPKEKPNKITSIKWLLKKGENIATTHALFSMFDDEIIELCYSQGYILFMDEVTNVIEPYGKMSKADLEMLKNDGYVSIDEKTNLIIWNEEKKYNGKFTDERIMCKNKCLAVYNGNISLWLFPVRIFEAFAESYILTYLFEAQMQKYYYDFNKLEYKYLYVAGDNINNYHFTTEPIAAKPKYNYKELINIIENERMNRIGELDHTLSKTWYTNHGHNLITNDSYDAVMDTLRKNTLNFFINIVDKRECSNNLWTTFKDYKKDLEGKGYARAFLVHSARATNAYANCHNVAYLINKYINPVVKNFFVGNGIKVDEDGYALSELLQFIWRSAIRKGEPINLYIPSKRMRNLLKEWIAENSLIEGDVNEK